jgi:hypothetical protein
MLAIWLGALLIICGVLFMANEALWGKRLSGTARPPKRVKGGTLEPRKQGLGFLGLARNWPGIALVALGAALLLIGAMIST